MMKRLLKIMKRMEDQDEESDENDDKDEDNNNDEILTQGKSHKRLKSTFFLVVSQWTLLFPIAPDDNDHKNDDDINDGS